MLGPQAASMSATDVVARIFLIVPDFPDSLGAAENFGEKLIVDLASSFFGVYSVQAKSWRSPLSLLLSVTESLALSKFSLRFQAFISTKGERVYGRSVLIIQRIASHHAAGPDAPPGWRDELGVPWSISTKPT